MLPVVVSHPRALGLALWLLTSLDPREIEEGTQVNGIEDWFQNVEIMFQKRVPPSEPPAWGPRSVWNAQAFLQPEHTSPRLGWRLSEGWWKETRENTPQGEHTPENGSGMALGFHISQGFAERQSQWDVNVYTVSVSVSINFCPPTCYQVGESLCFKKLRFLRPINCS